jgi:hypothetical protein
MWIPFEDILLSDDQKELLALMVEAQRAVPKDRRFPFLLSTTTAGSHLIHEGLSGNIAAYSGDLDSLAERGLLRLSFGSRGTPNYDVTNEGYAYYEWMKTVEGRPVEAVEAEVRSFLNSDSFRRGHAKAFERWRDAAERLWGADDDPTFTEIGHICREAIQAFAEDVGAAGNPDPTKTVDRIRHALGFSNAGSRTRAFAEALLAYWGTVSDLIVRQEHGARKEGEPLSWEDARRCVFQTALVMFEIDRLLQGR